MQRAGGAGGGGGGHHPLVDGNVGLRSIHVAECEAALLQLGLGVIPVLVQDEQLQTREEAHLAELPAKLQTLPARVRP